MFENRESRRKFECKKEKVKIEYIKLNNEQTYTPGHHENSINIQTVYIETIWLHENCDNKII
jgi:hypothetical protein